MTFEIDLAGQLEGLLRLALAAVAGGAIGFDRAQLDKPADVRTFALVATGSAAFTYVGMLAFGPTADGARVAAQIVTGIGFLGAGTIIHYRDDVIGLTTAAAIWSVAAIGMALGAGLYLLGLAGAGVILLLLRWHGLEPEARAETPEDDT